MARKATNRIQDRRQKAIRTLAAAIADAPQLADRKAAQARVAEWLGEHRPQRPPARRSRRLLAGAPKVEALLAGLADGSPYLWELVTAEPARLLALLQSDPDAHLADLLANTARPSRHRRRSEAMRLLRRMKAEAALLIALADIGGVWPVMRTTRALTELADTAVGAAVRFLLREAAAPRPAQARRPREARGGQRLHRARHGQDGRVRAQLFERHRPDRLLRPGGAGAAPARTTPAPFYRPPHARAGQAAAGAHRRRLCLPRRSAAAARSGLDPDRGLDRGGARTITRASARTGSAPR